MPWSGLGKPVGDQVAVGIVSHQAEIDKRKEADGNGEEEDPLQQKSEHDAESAQADPHPPSIPPQGCIPLHYRLLSSSDR